MIKELLRILLVGGIVASNLACAAKRPVLYPNERLETVGPAVAQQDIDACLQRAAEAGYKSHAAGEVAGSTGVGAAAGAAVGAAVGAVAGVAGRGHGRGRRWHGRPDRGALPFPGPGPHTAAVRGTMPSGKGLPGHRLAIRAGAPPFILS